MSKQILPYLKAIVADRQGNFFDLDHYAAVGMAGRELVPLLRDDTIHMPFGSETMFLPDRNPVVYNLGTETFEVLLENPYAPGEPVFPDAGFPCLR